MAAQLPISSTIGRLPHASRLETAARSRARSTLARGLLLATALSTAHAVDAADVLAVSSPTVAVASGAAACLVAAGSYVRTAYVRPYLAIRRMCAGASTHPLEESR